MVQHVGPTSSSAAPLLNERETEMDNGIAIEQYTGHICFRYFTTLQLLCLLVGRVCRHRQTSPIGSKIYDEQ